MIEQILEKMPNISNVQKKFIAMILNTFLATFGRLNFRNMSRYSGVCEKTIERNFAKKFSFVEFNSIGISMLGEPKELRALAFDPTFIPKSGKKTEGLGMFYNGCASRAERGLEASVFAIITADKKSAIPLSARLTIDDPSKETNRTDRYIEHLDDVISHLPKDVKHLVVDGYGYNKKFVAGVKKKSLYVVSKLRHNAVLMKIYVGVQKPRGRKRIQDGPLEASDFEQVTSPDKDVLLFSTCGYSTCLKSTITIVKVVDAQNTAKHMLLFSTDLTLAAHSIYQLYSARFQIEFIFRDAKQFAGLADCQAISRDKINFHINASLSALAVARIQHLLEYPEAHVPFSMASVKRAAYNKNFIAKIFSTFDFDLIKQKLKTPIESLVYYGIIS